MSESIPEDVMKAAREAAAKVWGVGEGSEALAAEFRSGMRDDSGSVETAVVAILAERNRNQWQDISTAPKNTKVLAAYQNYLGYWRIVTACYHTQLPWSDEYGDPEEEYAPEGWYEENDSSEVIYPTSRAPTHWQPLPAPPIPHNPTEG